MMRAPPSVNFHHWQPCNMSCVGCFAVFGDVKSTVLPRGHLNAEDSMRVVEALASVFDKITFVGGEPTLCPWLADLIASAKRRKRTTMIVTNGWRLSSEYLASLRGLDWVTISMDSGVAATHAALGRALRGRPMKPGRYIEISDLVRAAGMRLKLNTVVSAANFEEDMSELVARMRPERWKVLQLLPVVGQNDGSEHLQVGAEAFQSFVARHARLADLGIEIVPEDNEAMRGTYAMVDPAGRFFDNLGGRYMYGRSILDVGVEAAWNDVRFDANGFVDRGGIYEWSGPRPQDVSP